MTGGLPQLFTYDGTAGYTRQNRLRGTQGLPIPSWENRHTARTWGCYRHQSCGCSYDVDANPSCVSASGVKTWEWYPRTTSRAIVFDREPSSSFQPLSSKSHRHTYIVLQVTSCIKKVFTRSHQSNAWPTMSNIAANNPRNASPRERALL
jgi:hypothetical protein